MDLLDVWAAERRIARRFARQTRNLFQDYLEYRDVRPLLENLERNLMSQIERLQSAVSSQSDAITQMQQRVHEDVETLRTELADALAEKPELDQLLTQIEENTGTISSLDPVVQDVVDSGEVTPPAEETPSEVPAEETPVEEAPVDEAPLPEDSPTPDTDEVPTGGPVEEAPVEEAPAEELPAEEAPVEEAPAEDDGSV